MPILSKAKQLREQQYKAVRLAKNTRYGGSAKVPACKRCSQQHRRCPGPVPDDKGGWDFSKKCLRCEDMDDVDCDFQGKRNKTARNNSLEEMNNNLEEMTDNEEEVMVGSPRGKKRRVQVNSPDIQPAPKTRRVETQTTVHQSPNNQAAVIQPLNIHPSRAHQLTETQKRAAEKDLIAREIRYLFQEEPDVADYVLGVANISQQPTSSDNRHAEHEQASVTANPWLPSGSGPPVCPAPPIGEVTLASLITNPGGLPYHHSPYPKAEHDYEAEAKMYEAQEKEHQQMREAEFAKNPPTFPYPSTSSQPPISTGYGRAMGNGGVGTLSYLGINWESADEGGENDKQDGDEE